MENKRKLYYVTIREELSKTFVVSTCDMNIARKFIESKYLDGDIVLGCDDLLDCSCDCEESNSKDIKPDFILDEKVNEIKRN